MTNKTNTRVEQKFKKRRNLIAKALFDRSGPFRNKVKQTKKLYNRNKMTREMQRIEGTNDE